MTRVATALLVLVLAAAGLRASPATAACCDEDCAQPCCARDAAHASVVPLLPCCRTAALHEAAPTPAPALFDADHGAIAAVAVAVVPARLVIATASAATRALRAPRLRAPPLYQRHCALLI